jgi:hypothetical protein
MDCRVKPGNDEGHNERSPASLPGFAFFVLP